VTNVETESGAKVESPDVGRARPTAIELAESYTLVLVTIGIVVFFSLLPATRDLYLTPENIRTTLGNSAVLAVAAVAMIPPLTAGRYDLSIGAVLGFAAIAAAASMSTAGLGLPVAIGIALAVGAVFGVINGILTTVFRIDSLISTLAMATIIAGLVSFFTGGRAIASGIDPWLIAFGGGNFLGIPSLIYVVAAVSIALWYVLTYTPFGRQMQAIGVNEEAAQLVGIRVNRSVFYGFLISGVLAGVAGVMLVARSGGITPTAGPLYSLPAFAAVFLGATSIKPGRFNVAGTLVAILFLAAMTSGLNLAGAQDWVSSLVNGLALLIGVGLTAELTRRRRGA